MKEKPEMKEMLGGCCVCSDDQGWSDNPLIYCDGPGCEVAVHQGCYGIQDVPEDDWYCAKCHVSTSFNGHVNGADAPRRPARCDLCPLGYGALKRTEKQGWAHVVCALYIPEIRFGDVHSMDPIVVSDIPQERFDKPCYLCTNAGDIIGAASGACMSCNKQGCKRGFHVTCAQQRGLLCEESGGSKNVKYCGYCSHHMKKAALDPAIKRIPPCRVRPHPSSQLHCQPTPPSSNNSGHMLVDPLPRREQVVSSVLGLAAQAAAAAAAVASSEDGHLLNNFSPPLTTSSRSSVALDATPPLNSTQLVTTKVEPVLNGGPSTSSLNIISTMGQNHNRLGLAVAGVVPPVETNGHCPSTDEKPPVDCVPFSLHSITPSMSVSKALGGGKRSRDVKLEQGSGLEKAKRPRTNNRQSKNDMKALLDAVGPVVSETVSDFQRERMAVRSEAAEQQRQQQQQQMAPNIPSTSQDNLLPGHVPKQEQQQQQPPIAPMPNQSTPMNIAGMHILGTSPSTSRGGLSIPSSMEQLLERQWDQCSQFMVSQAQFDVAQLLSCLHQLKSENIRLEEQHSQLTRRREHLLALNSRLATPLTSAVYQPNAMQQPMLSSPQHHSPQVAGPSVPLPPPPVSSIPSLADDSLSQMRSLVSGQRTATARPPSQAAPAISTSTPSTSFATPQQQQQQHQQLPQSRHQQHNQMQSTVGMGSVPHLSTTPTSQPHSSASSSTPAASTASTAVSCADLNSISPERLAALNNHPLASLGGSFLGQRNNQLLPGMDQLVTQLLIQQAHQQLRYQQNPSTANLFAQFSSLIPPISGPGTVQGGNIGK